MGVILLLTALLLGVAVFLVAPLIGGTTRRTTQGNREVSSLMAERDRVINALQELDFDFKLGKVPEEDYPSQRAELLQKGADVLRRLDTIASSPSPLHPSPGGRGDGSEGSDAESRLEQAVTAHRFDAAQADGELSDDEIESMLAARRKGRKSKSTGFCPHCGKPVLASDQFCPNCGKALR